MLPSVVASSAMHLPVFFYHGKCKKIKLNFTEQKVVNVEKAMGSNCELRVCKPLNIFLPSYRRYSTRLRCKIIS